jgi:hypothetical protein
LANTQDSCLFMRNQVFVNCCFYFNISRIFSHLYLLFLCSVPQDFILLLGYPFQAMFRKVLDWPGGQH